MSETFEEWFDINIGDEYVLRSRRIMLEKAWNHQEKKLQAEREKVALLREAVEFYGDRTNWFESNSNPKYSQSAFCTPSDLYLSDRLDRDYYSGGKKARQALEKLKELEGEG